MYNFEEIAEGNSNKIDIDNITAKDINSIMQRMSKRLKVGWYFACDYSSLPYKNATNGEEIIKFLIKSKYVNTINDALHLGAVIIAYGYIKDFHCERFLDCSLKPYKYTNEGVKKFNVVLEDWEESEQEDEKLLAYDNWRDNDNDISDFDPYTDCEA
eukprot:Pgem_evm1s8070